MTEELWCYYGQKVTHQDYIRIKELETLGTCPWCGRAGLTMKYGSQRKHVVACGRLHGGKLTL